MIRETWRPVPVPAARDLYEVSDQGRVRNRKGAILKANDGGKIIVFRFPGKRRRGAAIAALVLEAFVGPRPRQGMVPVHQNGCALDHRLVNLRWGTLSEVHRIRAQRQRREMADA